MKSLPEVIGGMEPEDALRQLAPIIKTILGHLDEEARVRFVTGMIDDAGGDKISSMVNL